MLGVADGDPLRVRIDAIARLPCRWQPASWPWARRAARANWRSAARGVAGDRQPHRRASGWRSAHNTHADINAEQRNPGRGSTSSMSRSRRAASSSTRSRSMRSRFRSPYAQAAAAASAPSVGQRERKAAPSQTRAGDANGASRCKQSNEYRRRGIRGVRRGKSQPCTQREQQRERQQQLERRDSPEPEAHDGRVVARHHGKSPRDPSSSSRIATDDRPAP